MWTPATRQQHSRPVTRYQTDLTDAEWRVIAPHLRDGPAARLADARDHQRDILRDAGGLPVAAAAERPAGGGALLSLSRRSFPFIARVFPDSGYAGEKVAKATLIAVEIVRKNPDQVGFAVNPRRWVVIVCTMLPSWALSGHRSSSAGAASGDRRSLR
jgi:transposase